MQRLSLFWKHCSAERMLWLHRNKGRVQLQTEGGEGMIQIQIRYDEPEEKELAELYHSRILELIPAPGIPVVLVQRRK